MSWSPPATFWRAPYCPTIPAPDNGIRAGSGLFLRPEGSKSLFSNPKPDLPNFTGKEDVHWWLRHVEQLMDFYNFNEDLRVKMAALYLEGVPLMWYRGNRRAKGKSLSWAEFKKGLVSLCDNSKAYKVFDEIPQPLPLLIHRLLDKIPQPSSRGSVIQTPDNALSVINETKAEEPSIQATTTTTAELIFGEEEKRSDTSDCNFKPKGPSECKLPEVFHLIGTPHHVLSLTSGPLEPFLSSELAAMYSISNNTPDTHPLFNKILHRNPVERVTFEEFFNHEFITMLRLSGSAPQFTQSTAIVHSRKIFGKSSNALEAQTMKKRATRQGFLGEGTAKVSNSVESTEQYISLIHAHLTSVRTLSSSLEIPDAMEIIFQPTLSIGKSDDVDELMGHKNGPMIIGKYPVKSIICICNLQIFSTVLTLSENPQLDVIEGCGRLCVSHMGASWNLLQLTEFTKCTEEQRRLYLYSLLFLPLRNTGYPENIGIQTSEDYRLYAISAHSPEFSNKDKTLVFQFTVQHEQKLDCGGGYMKLLHSDVDQKKFGGETSYSIMFGPDICGYSTKKVQTFLFCDGKNHLIKRVAPCETDQLSHVYTFITQLDSTTLATALSAILQLGRVQCVRLVMQRLAGSRIIEVNNNMRKDLSFLNDTEKFLGIFNAIGMALTYVLTGMYGSIIQLGAGNVILIILQFCFAGIIIICLDDIFQEGLRCFETVKEDYHLESKMKHYGCIINIQENMEGLDLIGLSLGRLKSFDEIFQEYMGRRTSILGCSSKFVLFYENGPNPITDTMSRTWNDYGGDKALFKEHPNYLMINLYITGESYIGYYIFVVAEGVIKQADGTRTRGAWRKAPVYCLESYVPPPEPPPFRLHSLTRKVCLLFCIIHLCVGIMKNLSRHLSMWITSPCLALASSVFFYCFEIWMVAAHVKQCHGQELLNGTFWLMNFFESTSLIGSQRIANVLVKDIHKGFLPSAVVLLVMICLSLAQAWNIAMVGTCLDLVTRTVGDGIDAAVGYLSRKLEGKTLLSFDGVMTQILKDLSTPQL